MDHQRLVVRPFVAGGELRHDVQLLVDVEQLVAQPGEHDAADIGGGQCRVHHVQVLPQRDAQGLRECRDDGDQHAGGSEQESGA